MRAAALLLLRQGPLLVQAVLNVEQVLLACLDVVGDLLADGVSVMQAVEYVLSGALTLHLSPSAVRDDPRNLVDFGLICALIAKHALVGFQNFSISGL